MIASEARSLWTYFRPVILDTLKYSLVVLIKHAMNVEIFDFRFDCFISLIFPFYSLWNMKLISKCRFLVLFHMLWLIRIHAERDFFWKLSYMEHWYMKHCFIFIRVLLLFVISIGDFIFSQYFGWSKVMVLSEIIKYLM